MFLQKINIKSVFKRPRIRKLSPELISRFDAPYAPEDGDDLHTLAESISRFGMLHPVTVRKSGKGFELISGRRRLLAAKMCGLKKVPCIILEADDKNLWTMRLSENLHRHKPDFLEIAGFLKQLVYEQGLTVDEAAAYSGLAVKQVVSLLRVLSLPRHILFALRDSGLTERHALSLLRLSGDELREAALCEMAYMDMGPEAAERYVDKLLKIRTPEEIPGQRPLYIVKDVRMFLNSISHGMDMMRGGGIDAECVREDSDNCIKLTIRIPEKSAPAEKAG